jgi:dolichol kinase/splicing factor 3B subunit 1
MAASSALVMGERLAVFLFAPRVALAAPACLVAPLVLLAAVELAVDRSASDKVRRFSPTTRD